MQNVIGKDTQGLVELVSARIEQLPELPKKVFALYHYEGLTVAEIAQVFGLSEDDIVGIHEATRRHLLAFAESVTEQRRGRSGDRNIYAA
jgi:DNA-directed RNA polymerase specialized sigma subunit